MRFATYDEALAWLESHVDLERVAGAHRTPSLEPTRAVLAALADPQRDYPSVHVTGTNGKGTTTTLTSVLLMGAGLRVGTYTSPDLHAVNERVAVDGRPIADEDLVGLLERLSDVESSLGLTLSRFELLTVAALLHFSDEGVDVAVVEVGMGGTWDATNVIDSSVAVLTNVDLDHTEVLGPSVAAIARDKVGIFRPDGVALVATTDPEVVAIAASRARAVGATLWRLDEEFELVDNELAVGGRALTLRTPFATYEEVLLSLHGIHQGVNAATAIAAAEAFLGRALGDEVVTTTLAGVSMPGRLEVVSHDPLIVVDGAHNPAGVRALAVALDGAFDITGARRCVLGVLRGRDLDDTVRPLLGAGFVEFHVCAPRSPRAVPPGELAAVLRRHGAVAFEHPSAMGALAHAREHSSDEDLIVVCGSLYLVAEVRGELLHVADRHRR